MELKLPAPCVIVLIGPAGSGKTTWALDNFRSNEVVSSDTLRAMVGIDEDDQRASRSAFEILESVFEARTRRGLTTVLDTTGLDQDNRVSWVARSHERNLPVYAVLMETSPQECQRRNAERDRPLPQSVLNKQITGFTKTAAHLEDEGFDGILRPQPVAAVSPQLRTADEEEVPGQPAATHTFGLILSRFNWPGKASERADQIAAVAQRAEQAGFRDIWLMDHFRQIHQVGRPWEDLPEAYTTLSYIAGVTQQIRLGTLVTGITHRNPVLLGKMIATLDVLSGGRANCGIGAAWDAKEHAAYGIAFPGVSDRYDLLEDTIQMLQLLWGKGSPSFYGKVLQAPELVCYPRPIQKHIPILIGGSGEKRTLRLVAEYADACNLLGSTEVTSKKVEVLRGHCSEVERDPDEIEVTHLTGALAAGSRAELDERINRLRGRDQSLDDYAHLHNAGTVDDLVGLFREYHSAGAHHSIVSIPDVEAPGTIEAFGDVIASFQDS